ncbi:hypothetical protein [Roseateles sp. YR242]|uniref:hypothetical protein n=1 Tax=Roseateles sp. YR242 TaxID=1855305 RepID=UPI001160B858|nr:hypothetical protein [Roseateles sp. YR242]
MTAKSLEVGSTYYRIAYADVDETMPSVEPLVYVGTNFFGPHADGIVSYYFQDTVSATRFGLKTPTPISFQNGSTSDANGNLGGNLERIFSRHEASEIGETIVDLLTLPHVINSAIERAQAKGFPKLAKAKGRWV